MNTEGLLSTLLKISNELIKMRSGLDKFNNEQKLWKRKYLIYDTMETQLIQ